MSCTTITDEQRKLVELVPRADRCPTTSLVLEELVQKGWAMRTGELTDVGRSHVAAATGTGDTEAAPADEKLEDPAIPMTQLRRSDAHGFAIPTVLVVNRKKEAPTIRRGHHSSN